MGKAETNSIENEVRALLAPFGLVTFGWFSDAGYSGLLIGNIGKGHWASFCDSTEFRDGKKNPLDRWTRRIVTNVVGDVADEIRFPFGERLWPFQTYAKQATGMQHSPIGLLIHPEYGLWTSFRAALMFKAVTSSPRSGGREHPCDRCDDKPCLNSCPVDAFNIDRYDRGLCQAHLSATRGLECMQKGCLARLACPVGLVHANVIEQQAFHMKAFVGRG